MGEAPFCPVGGLGTCFFFACRGGNQDPNRHVIGRDDQYWTLHAELGDKSSRSNNNI